MEKLPMESMNLIEENIEKLKTLFPTCVTETRDANGRLKQAVNFDALRMVLSNAVSDGPDTYGFQWVGKQAAEAEAYSVIHKTLRPCTPPSKNWEKTENLYIEGDNLDALKLLQKSYMGKVKMIYIDPPYNTGHDFIYKDKFRMEEEDYAAQTELFDEEGNKQFAENNDSNPRFHSDWCSMIYPRLLLARNLLTDDGVIFISIDDNEQSTLKNICNEIFGETKFAGQIPWRKRTAKSDVPFGISQDYEWIICYAKSDKFKAGIAGKERKYYETPDFPGKPWRIHDLTKQTTASERPNSFFTIVNPKTGEQYRANPNSTWRITKETLSSYLSTNRIVFPGDYPFLSIQKPALRYWKEDDIKKSGENFGKVAVSTKLPDNIGMTQDGTKEITELFGSKIFGFPKPTSLLKFLVKISTPIKKDDDIVLDFFSGSATTAHAVMELNAEDGGHRKFIMVQAPEPCAEKSEAYKAGYRTICDIGEERIRRAGEKIRQEHPDVKVDTGFRVFRVDTTNMEDVYYRAGDYQQSMLAGLISNVKPDRTGEDLLFGCLLNFTGITLDRPYAKETCDGCTVYDYDDGTVLACFDLDIPESLVESMARREPAYAIFQDSSFAESAARINVTEIFKRFSPLTRVTVI